jgi:hypothetical protein
MKNAAIIWTFAGVIAAACFARGLKVGDGSPPLFGLLWYTLGASVLAGASVLWITLEDTIMMQHKIVLAVCGAFFGGLALMTIGEWIHPTGANAQSPANPPGCSNSAGGNNSGSMTNNCVFNVAPQRLRFSSELGSQLLSAMPEKRKVHLQSIGGQADQAVASEIQSFLEQNGYPVERTAIGMMAPPPDHKISLGSDAGSYVLVVAPSATE